MRARARISMAATSDEGLSEQLPVPCDSLLLGVADGSGRDDGDLCLGVRITTTFDEALVPGSTDVLVELRVLSDLAEKYLAPEATFTLRHPLQIVGRGRVLNVWA